MEETNNVKESTVAVKVPCGTIVPFHVPSVLDKYP